MAYLHCHTKDCGWSQDDFWTRRYNPFTKIWSDIKWLWIPRIMDLDDWIVIDIFEYTKVPVKNFSKIKGQYRIHTWNWLLIEIVKEIKNVFNQKWWTYKSWQRNKHKAKCPKCGQRNFDID